MATPRKQPHAISRNHCYTVRQLADILGKSTDWIYEHVTKAGCPTSKIGNVRLIDGAEFIEWVRSHSRA